MEMRPDHQDKKRKQALPQSPPELRGRGGKPPLRLLLPLLLGGAAALYLNALGGGFVWDDRSLILANPLVQSLGNALGAFQGKLRLFNNAFGYYRPLSLLSLALDHTLWGANPLGYHLTNLLLHLACVTALFFLLEVSFGRRIALWAAVLFATFAVHTENVAFISGRMDILCTLFILLCLLAYFRKPISSFATILLCFFLVMSALLAKELGAVLLLLLPLGILFRSPREAWKGRFLRTTTFLFPAFLVYGFLRIQALGGLTTLSSPAFSLAQRLLFLPGLIMRYLALLIFPLGLNALHKIYPPADLWGFVIPLFVVIFVILALLLLSRRSPSVGLGGLWFLASLLPVMNLLPLEGSVMADRFLYLPSAGFALLLAGFPGALKKKDGEPLSWTRNLFRMILLAILLSNAVFTARRNPVWRDEMIFFSRCVEQNPQSAMAHHNLGYVYYRKGDWPRAEAEYRQAISLSPAYADPHATLGDILAKTGRYAEAIQEYEAYLRYNPRALNRDQALEKIARLKTLLSGEAP